MANLPLSGLRATWCPALPCPGPVSLAHLVCVLLPFPTSSALLLPHQHLICLCICICVDGHTHARLCPPLRLRAAGLRYFVSSTEDFETGTLPATQRSLSRSFNHQLARSLACSLTHSVQAYGRCLSFFAHPRPSGKDNPREEETRKAESLERKGRKKKKTDIYLFRSKVANRLSRPQRDVLASRFYPTPCRVDCNIRHTRSSSRGHRPETSTTPLRATHYCDQVHPARLECDSIRLVPS